MTARPGPLPRRAFVPLAARRVVERTFAPRRAVPSAPDGSPAAPATAATATAATATDPPTAAAADPATGTTTTGATASGTTAGAAADPATGTTATGTTASGATASGATASGATASGATASGPMATDRPAGAAADPATGATADRVADPTADAATDPPTEAAGRVAEAAADAVPAIPPADRPHGSLIRRTLSKAWHDRLLGLSAEAAFWSLLSLPPLFLALLGSLGYFAGTLGPDRVSDIEAHLLAAFSRAFSPTVVDQLIQPTVSEVLRQGRADVISIGFLISLWAGSSAMATFVNTVTIAYGMRDLRGAVRSRLLALGLFLLTIIVGVVTLPLLVLGPSVLVDLVPDRVQPDATRLVNALYWPVVAGILLAGLITFYHLAVPKRLRWWRGVPGALLAAAVFVLGGTALRVYIGFVVGQGLSYGALAAPIAALLFFFVIGIAVIIGAEMNAMVEQLWPSGPTRRQRRRAAAAAASTPPAAAGTTGTNGGGSAGEPAASRDPAG